MEKTLLAGPWIGEFGWELFQFQGYIRALRPQYSKIVVSSRPGNEFLYEDFADEFVPYEPKGIHAECELLLDHQRDEEFYRTLFLDHRPTRWIHPVETTRNNATGQWAPSYRKYGLRGTGVVLEPEFDVVIHARQARKRGDMQAHRNWDQTYLEELVKRLPTERIAFIGRSGDCGYVEGYADYRDRPLKELSSLFDKSKMLIGSSSGPMHFGSLCGIPHIVTFGAQDGAMGNHARYKTDWNPFQTPVITIGDAWAPKQELILEAVDKWL